MSWRGPMQFPRARFSVMDCVSPCWLSGSTITLKRVKSICSKTLRITSVNERQTRVDLVIPLLHHINELAATHMLYKTHTSLYPPAIKLMFPQPCMVTQAICTSVSLPRQVVTEMISRTFSAGWTFIYSAVQISDRLPDTILYETEDNWCSDIHELCASWSMQ